MATSRPPRLVQSLLSQDFPDSIWICYNGAEIWKDGEPFFRQAIPTVIVRRIIQKISLLDSTIPILLETEDTLHANFDGDIPWKYKLNPTLYKKMDKPISKILLLFNGANGVVNDLLDEFHNDCEILFTDDSTLVQIMGRAVNKATATNKLLSEWGIFFEEVISFGDDVNDIEMLKRSGIGVAMGNSYDAVKSIADRITLTNDEDGVAHEFEKMFWGKYKITILIFFVDKSRNWLVLLCYN